jgi:hypothetical protein
LTPLSFAKFVNRTGLRAAKIAFVAMFGLSPSG